MTEEKRPAQVTEKKGLSGADALKPVPLNEGLAGAESLKPSQPASDTTTTGSGNSGTPKDNGKK